MNRETTRSLARITFWCAILFAYVSAVIPSAPNPTGWDKTNHMLAFGTIAMLGRIGWSRTRALQIAAALIGFGILIELSQALPIVARDASVGDVVADAIGVAIGLAVGWALLLAIRAILPGGRD